LYKNHHQIITKIFYEEYNKILQKFIIHNSWAMDTFIYKDINKYGLAFCTMSILRSSDLPRPSTTMIAKMMDEKLPSSFTLCSIIAENRDVIMADTST
jgi:hypothetical protein